MPDTLDVTMDQVRAELRAHLAELPPDQWPIYAPWDALSRRLGWDSRYGPGEKFMGQVKRALNEMAARGELHKDKGYSNMPRYYSGAAWLAKLADKAARDEERRRDRQRWAVVYDVLIAQGRLPHTTESHNPVAQWGRPRLAAVGVPGRVGGPAGPPRRDPAMSQTKVPAAGSVGQPVVLRLCEGTAASPRPDATTPAGGSRATRWRGSWTLVGTPFLG
jgi:hypothetical protein